MKGSAADAWGEAAEPEEIQQERERQEEIQQERKQQEIQEEEIQKERQQEELDCYLPVDFSVLLARRQQFVEEIRHKRFRPKKKKKKGYVLGLPSWFFANADDNPLSAAVTKAGAPFLLSSFLCAHASWRYSLVPSRLFNSFAQLAVPG
jgi:hypothetical protein